MAKILVVDDDRSQRLLYLRELSTTGYSVQAAESAQQALHLFSTDPPDLVVLDIRMPGLDGLDLMGRILAKDRRIPIILHSAYSCYLDNYLSWAADAYVTKSSDLTHLKNTVEKLLSRRASSTLGRLIPAGRGALRKPETGSAPDASLPFEEVNSSGSW